MQNKLVEWVAWVSVVFGVSWVAWVPVAFGVSWGHSLVVRFMQAAFNQLLANDLGEIDSCWLYVCAAAAMVPPVVEFRWWLRTRDNNATIDLAAAAAASTYYMFVVWTVISNTNRHVRDVERTRWLNCNIHGVFSEVYRAQEVDLYGNVCAL